MNYFKKHVHFILIGFDDFCNTLTGGNPDETLSSRSGRARSEGKIWGKLLAGFLDWLQENHCKTAIYNDIIRAEAVIKLEKEGQ